MGHYRLVLMILPLLLLIILGYGVTVTGAGATSWVGVDDDGESLKEDEYEAMPNHVQLAFYLGIPPGHETLPQYRLSMQAVTEFVNETSRSKCLMHPYPFTEQSPSPQSNNVRVPDTWELYYENETTELYYEDETLNQTLLLVWNQNHSRRLENNSHLASSIWWWKYVIWYSCFWGNSSKTIENHSYLDVIANEIHQSMAKGIKSGALKTWISTTKYNLTALNNATWKMTPPPNNNNHVWPPYPPSNHSFPPGNNKYNVDPLDPRVWNWSRWLGLSLFCGTVLFTTTVMLLARWRRSILYRQQNWYNQNSLDSNRGVDALLQMGWQIKGSHMEIYDKAAIGYVDNDSLFLGGYEQREPRDMGEITSATGEITVTHNSEETVNTRTGP